MKKVLALMQENKFFDLNIMKRFIYVYFDV